MSARFYTPNHMDVVVFGKHVEVPPDLRAHTRDKLERIGKFASDVRRVDVDFDEHATRKLADSHSCEILVHLNKHLVKGRAAAADHYAALDIALDKVEQQMRRLHERRVRRRSNTKAGRTNGAAGSNGEAVESEEYEEAADGAEGTVIVKTKQFAIKPMTPEEAALQMELLGHDFFFFTNAETGKAAVVYRRDDGDIGLIDAT